MKLYKFRPLANKDDFERLKGILETGEFHCSKFTELNDPMEGVYNFSDYDNRPEAIGLILGAKASYKICSFSDEKAFSDPKMWGYYANGFRGVGVEIEVCREEVEEINYEDDVLSFPGLNPDEEAKKILTTKLLPWGHEYEYRFLKKDYTNNRKFKIGKITALYYGSPYEKTINENDIIENRSALKKYIELKDNILLIAKELGLNCVKVKIEKCKVVKKTVLDE